MINIKNDPVSSLEAFKIAFRNFVRNSSLLSALDILYWGDHHWCTSLDYLAAALEILKEEKGLKSFVYEFLFYGVPQSEFNFIRAALDREIKRNQPVSERSREEQVAWFDSILNLGNTPKLKENRFALDKPVQRGFVIVIIMALELGLEIYGTYSMDMGGGSIKRIYSYTKIIERMLEGIKEARKNNNGLILVFGGSLHGLIELKDEERAGYAWIGKKQTQKAFPVKLEENGISVEVGFSGGYVDDPYISIGALLQKDYPQLNYLHLDLIPVSREDLVINGKHQRNIKAQSHILRNLEDIHNSLSTGEVEFNEKAEKDRKMVLVIIPTPAKQS